LIIGLNELLALRISLVHLSAYAQFDCNTFAIVFN
jgi:hypothetical protein